MTTALASVSCRRLATLSDALAVALRVYGSTSHDAGSMLRFYCDNGDVEKARKLLEDDPSIVYSTDDDVGKTALMVACQRKRVECVDLLLDFLKRGTKDQVLEHINATTKDGLSNALIYACMNTFGSNEIDTLACVESLISLGASAIYTNAAGQNALNTVCKNNMTEVAKILLSTNQYDQTPQTKDGPIDKINTVRDKSALMEAAHNDNRYIVSELLLRGADSTLRNKNQRTYESFASPQLLAQNDFMRKIQESSHAPV